MPARHPRAPKPCSHTASPCFIEANSAAQKLKWVSSIGDAVDRLQSHCRRTDLTYWGQDALWSTLSRAAWDCYLAPSSPLDPATPLDATTLTEHHVPPQALTKPCDLTLDPGSPLHTAAFAPLRTCPGAGPAPVQMADPAQPPHGVSAAHAGHVAAPAPEACGAPASPAPGPAQATATGGVTFTRPAFEDFPAHALPSSAPTPAPAQSAGAKLFHNIITLARTSILKALPAAYHPPGLPPAAVKGDDAAPAVVPGPASAPAGRSPALPPAFPPPSPASEPSGPDPRADAYATPPQAQPTAAADATPFKCSPHVVPFPARSMDLTPKCLFPATPSPAGVWRVDPSAAARSCAPEMRSPSPFGVWSPSPGSAPAYPDAVQPRTEGAAFPECGNCGPSAGPGSATWNAGDPPNPCDSPISVGPASPLLSPGSTVLRRMLHAVAAEAAASGPRRTGSPLAALDEDLLVSGVPEHCPGAPRDGAVVAPAGTPPQAPAPQAHTYSPASGPRALPSEEAFVRCGGPDADVTARLTAVRECLGSAGGRPADGGGRASGCERGPSQQAARPAASAADAVAARGAGPDPVESTIVTLSASSVDSVLQVAPPPPNARGDALEAERSNRGLAGGCSCSDRRLKGQFLAGTKPLDSRWQLTEEVGRADYHPDQAHVCALACCHKECKGAVRV